MKKILGLIVVLFVSITMSAQGVVTKDSLLDVYVTGARPTQSHFHSWLNSYYHNLENIWIDYTRGLYLYASGATIPETNGNIRLSFVTATKAALSVRESGVWYEMLKFPTFDGLTGRFVSINHSHASGVGLAIRNTNVLGSNAFAMVLENASQDTFLIIQNPTDVRITTGQVSAGVYKDLYINGVEWPPVGAGTELWTDNTGGSIYFQGVNTRVGINNTTPSANLHVKGSNDLFATRNTLIVNNSETRGFEVRNDGSSLQTGDGVIHRFVETLTTGTGSAIQWYRGGSLYGSIGMVDNDLNIGVPSGLLGYVNLIGNGLDVQDGIFKITSSGSVPEIFVINEPSSQMYFGKRHADADVTFRRTINTASTKKFIKIIGARGGGALFEPTSDYSVIDMELDSINPTGATSVYGITMVGDSLAGIPTAASPNGIYPMFFRRGFNETGGSLKVVADGKIDIVQEDYFGYKITRNSMALSLGSPAISSGSWIRLISPNVGAYHSYPAAPGALFSTGVGNEDRITYKGRYTKECVATFNISFNNTTATVATYIAGISYNGDDAETNGRYQLKTNRTSDGIENITVTSYINMANGDYVNPVFKNNNGATLVTDIFKADFNLQCR